MQKKIYFLSTLLLTLLIFSCSQQPIFWAIAQEIKLFEPSVKGSVRSVVRCGNFLYTANGNIYRKSLTQERGWEKISKPAGAGRAVYLASSNSYVYALAANGDDCQVYALNPLSGGWQEVAGASGKADKIALFDNQVSGAEQKAYVRVGGSVYKLNGITSISTLTAITTNGAGEKTVATARLGTTEYFSDTRAFCSYGTNLYSADGKKIKKGTTNADLTDTSVGTSEDVICLTYANNRLIAGTNKGLEEIRLSAGDPQSAGILEGNAEAAFGESEIFSVACFGPDDNDTIYAGAGKKKTSKYNALWGYYPSRGNWNYE